MHDRAHVCADVWEHVGDDVQTVRGHDVCDEPDGRAHVLGGDVHADAVHAYDVHAHVWADFGAHVGDTDDVRDGVQTVRVHMLAHVRDDVRDGVLTVHAAHIRVHVRDAVRGGARADVQIVRPHSAAHVQSVLLPPDGFVRSTLPMDRKPTPSECRAHGSDPLRCYRAMPDGDGTLAEGHTGTRVSRTNAVRLHSDADRSRSAVRGF